MLFPIFLILIRTFLFTDTTNRIDIATSGNILTHLFKLPLGYFDRRPVGEISTRISELGQNSWVSYRHGSYSCFDVIFGTVYFFVLISYSGLAHCCCAMCDSSLFGHGFYRGPNH